MKHETKTSGKKLESLFLTTLFIFGIFGAFYFFNQGSHPQEAELTGHWEQSETSTGGMVAAADGNISNNPILHIEGIMEAGVPLLFAVPSADQSGRYVLDLGNGETILLDENTHYYTYRKPGTYRVKLEQIRNGKREIIFSEFLNIEAGIEVAHSGY